MYSQNQFEEKLRQVEYVIDMLKSRRRRDQRRITREYYINKFFALELLKTTPLPPMPSGEVLMKHFEMMIPTCNYDFHVYRRIVGPAGSTVKAIERFSGTKVTVTILGSCDVQVSIDVQDYENIIDWRFEKVQEAINYVLENKNSEVSLNQMAEHAVRVGYRKIPRISNRYDISIYPFNRDDDEATMEANEEDEKQIKATAMLMNSNDDKTGHNFQ
ncbi:hypothetical protein T4B_2396 [Trichinella pseudospiralis]|uniref:K Homology domain-containing protein n=1 Tax=Trichinella pseudospiralis TaxID=6337 RepID=A0A0V1J396_TRIPS|nr:hypothetical protein T4B_2396 [Trichinella pseudospiralis]KRZ29433.1 hypothetical protein T4C_13756 [Trichinella pseudospiralis]